MTEIAKKKEREREREYTPVIGVNFLKFWFQKTAISHKITLAIKEKSR